MNARQLFTTHSLEELAETAKKLRIDATKKGALLGDKLGLNYPIALDTCHKVTGVQSSLQNLISILENLSTTNSTTSSSKNQRENIITPVPPQHSLDEAKLLSIDEAWTYQNNGRYLEAVSTLEGVMAGDSIFSDTIRRAKSVFSSDYVESLCNELSPSVEDFDRIRYFLGSDINQSYLESHRKKISALDDPHSISNEIQKVYLEYIRWNRDYGPELEIWLDQVLDDLRARLSEHPEISIPLPLLNADLPTSMNERWKNWADEVQLIRDQRRISSFFTTLMNKSAHLSQLQDELHQHFIKVITPRLLASSKVKLFWDDSVKMFLEQLTPEVTQDQFDIGSIVAFLDCVGRIIDKETSTSSIIHHHLGTWFAEIFQMHRNLLFPPVRFNSYPSSSLILFFYTIFREIRHAKLLYYEIYLKRLLIQMSNAILQEYLANEKLQQKTVLCDITLVDKICETNQIDASIKTHSRYASTTESEFEDALSIANLEFSRVALFLSPFFSGSFTDELSSSTRHLYVSCPLECPIIPEASHELQPTQTTPSSFKVRHNLVSQASMSSLTSKSKDKKTLLFTEKAKMMFDQSRSLFSPQ